MEKKKKEKRKLPPGRKEGTFPLRKTRRESRSKDDRTARNLGEAR